MINLRNHNRDEVKYCFESDPESLEFFNFVESRLLCMKEYFPEDKNKERTFQENFRLTYFQIK